MDPVTAEQSVTFWSWCADHWALCAFVIAMFVQITPVIKFNPFTALFKWIGKVMTKDVSSTLVDVKESIKEQGIRLDAQSRAIDANEMDRIRWEILDFANSIRNGRRHSKLEYEHIFELNKKYEALLNKCNMKNGVYEADFKYIQKVYNECLEKNNFLA